MRTRPANPEERAGWHYFAYIGDSVCECSPAPRTATLYVLANVSPVDTVDDLEPYEHDLFECARCGAVVTRLDAMPEVFEDAGNDDDPAWFKPSDVTPEVLDVMHGGNTKAPAGAEDLLYGTYGARRLEVA